jgi:hypothetical protein
VPTRTPPWISRAALLAGAAIALAIAIAGRVDGGSAVPGAELTLAAATPEGLVALPDAKPFLHGRDLRPGGPPATGSLRIRNAADRPLAVRIGMVAPSHELDGLLAVRLATRGRVLRDGRLGRLEPAGKPIALAPGEERTIRVRAWLPETDASDWQARAVEGSIRFAVRPLGRS